MVENSDRGIPACYQTGQGATTTSAPLLGSLPYSALPVRSADGANPILCTIEAVNFNTSLVISALSRLREAYVRSLNHPGRTSLVQVLEQRTEMTPRYGAYRRA